MKRIVCILMCQCMLLGLGGCAVQPAQPTTEATQPTTTEVTQPTTEVTQPTTGATEGPDTPGIVAIPQVGEYAEFILMDGVPGQQVCELLSTRSDGTVDYIFTKMGSFDAWSAGIYSLREAGYRYFTVAPDGTATEQPADWMDQLDEVIAATTEKNQNARWHIKFDGACEGNILINLRFLDGVLGGVIYSTFYHLYDGVLTQIPMEQERKVEVEGTTFQLPIATTSPLVVEDGLLFCVSGGRFDSEKADEDAEYLFTFAYDGTLKSSTVLKDSDAWNFFVNGNTVFFFTRGDNKLHAIDARDGTRQYEQELGSDSSYRMICGTPDGSAVYGLFEVAGQLVLKRVSRNGVEVLTEDPGPYAFAMTDYSLDEMVVDNNGTVYTAANGVLRQYRYNPEGAVQVKYLTVYALEDNQTVRAAVTQWNQTHTDIQCRFTTAEEQIAGTSLTIDDAITQLNTRLVNGEGPDVLILDGLPVDSMMDKGFLEPLSGLDTTGVYPNLVERFTLDGTLYAIPAKMTPYLLGRSVAEELPAGSMVKTQPVGSLEEFADIVESGTVKLNTGYFSTKETTRNWYDDIRDEGMALYYAKCSDHVFDLWYPAWMDAIWDGGSFHPETYQEFLTQTGRLVEHYSLISFDTFVERYGITSWEYDIIGDTDGHIRLDASPYPYCLTASNNIGLHNFVPGILSNSAWGNTPIPIEITGIPGPDGTGITVPTTITAVRAGSNTQAGVEFIQLLLSDKVQNWLGPYETDGYPVKWSCTPAELEKTEVRLGSGFGQEFDITNDFEQALSALRCDIIDEVLFQAARSAALDYYEGKLTLEEATEQVKAETALYLAEQR